MYIKDICNTILKVLKLMTASFCKRNSADNEEINHYLTHQKGGGVGVMSHDYTIYKYNTLLFRIKTYMIFVQMNFYIIFQTVLINLFEVGFFFKKGCKLVFIAD